VSNNKDKKMSPTPVDYDKDGKVSDEEIKSSIKLERSTAQMKIASVALGAMIALMVFLLTPFAPGDETITALTGVITTVIMALAGIVGAYMGFTAWMTKE
jgi:VIT1/CCC1 family predicted Fe2+/Mn2+ transporter